MDHAGGHMNKMDGPEHAHELHSAPITLAEFVAHVAEIRNDLIFNARHPEENPYSEEGRAARKEAYGNVREAMHGFGEHDALFVAREGSKIVGYLAIELTPLGRGARVRELRTMRPDKEQRRVVIDLLIEAKRHLAERGYEHKIDVEVSSPESGIARAFGDDLRPVLRLSRAAANGAEQPSDLDHASESEGTREAASDGEKPLDQAAQ